MVKTKYLEIENASLHLTDITNSPLFVFEFTGSRRFHFSNPHKNKYAV